MTELSRLLQEHTSLVNVSLRRTLSAEESARLSQVESDVARLANEAAVAAGYPTFDFSE
jgi:hypothetical protein